MWKNVGHFASEEGKSCEKLKDFGFVGPRMWKNVGKLASEERKDSWCKLWGQKLEKCGKFCARKGLRLHH